MKNLLIICGLLLGPVMQCEAAKPLCITKSQHSLTDDKAQKAEFDLLAITLHRDNRPEDELLNKTRKLLNQGVDINQKHHSLTLLMLAVGKGYGALVHMLLDAGADLNMRSSTGMTALMIGAYQQEAEMCRLLIQHMEKKRQYGTVARALMECMGSCDIKGAYQVLTGFNQEGIDATDDTGMTALMYAAHNRDKTTTALLLHHGAQANAQNKFGMTPLMLSCGAPIPQTERAFDEIITLSIDACVALLQNGADIRRRDQNGRSALLHAAEALGEDECKLLLSQGAKETHFNRSGYPPIKADNLPLAALHNKEVCLRVLLDAGVPVDTALHGGTTTLHCAASSGSLGCINTLLDAGADTELRDEKSFTPLYNAAANGHKQAVDALVKAGANRILDFSCVEHGYSRHLGESIKKWFQQERYNYEELAQEIDRLKEKFGPVAGQKRFL